MDIAEHARVLSPNLALNFSQPLPGGAADAEMELDSLNSFTEEELQPLLWLPRKLHCLVDDRVHLQQAAGTTKVGYNAYYDHKLAQIQSLTNLSGSRVDKEFWVHDQTDTEKDILKTKAHDNFCLWYLERIRLVVDLVLLVGGHCKVIPP